MYRSISINYSLFGYFRRISRGFCDLKTEIKENEIEWHRAEEDSKKFYRRLIPLNKMEISYSTSSAPGGQNVNKNPTRAEIRFKIDECDWIDEKIRKRFLDANQHRINRDGYFQLRSELTPSQKLNLNDCFERLRRSIREIAQEIQREENAKPTEEELLVLKRREDYAEKRRIREKRMASERKREKRIDYYD